MKITKHKNDYYERIVTWKESFGWAQFGIGLLSSLMCIANLFLTIHLWNDGEWSFLSLLSVCFFGFMASSFLIESLPSGRDIEYKKLGSQNCSNKKRNHK